VTGMPAGPRHARDSQDRVPAGARPARRHCGRVSSEILSLAAKWAYAQEEKILCEGAPLSADQLADAVAAGVREPQRVRVLLVEEVPAPPNAIVLAAAKEVATLPQRPSGLTLGHGVFIRNGREQDRHLVAHELAHTAQYERLGGIVPFLRDYLTQCATFGYQSAPLEREAEEVATQICGA